MNYEIMIRTWVKTLSNTDFLRYEVRLKEEIEKEKSRRGLIKNGPQKR